MLIQRVPYSGEEKQIDVRKRTALRMTLAASGQVPLSDEELAHAALRARLQGLRTRRNEIVLVVDIDREARVEDLLVVEDAARSAGLRFLIQRDREPPAKVGGP